MPKTFENIATDESNRVTTKDEYGRKVITRNIHLREELRKTRQMQQGLYGAKVDRMKVESIAETVYEKDGKTKTHWMVNHTALRKHKGQEIIPSRK